MLFTLPLADSSFSYRTQPEGTYKVLPIPDCIKDLLVVPMMLFVCLHVFFLSSFQKVYFTVAETTVDFVVVSPILGTVTGMW